MMITECTFIIKQQPLPPYFINLYELYDLITYLEQTDSFFQPNTQFPFWVAFSRQPATSQFVSSRDSDTF